MGYVIRNIAVALALQDCEELKAYVLEKLTIHEIHTRNYQNLADVLKVQYEFIGEFDSAAQSLSSSSASYVLEKMKKKQSGQSSTDRLLQMQTSEESKNDGDSFSSKKSKKSVFELNQAKKMEALNSKRHTLASKSMKLPPLLESPTELSEQRQQKRRVRPVFASAVAARPRAVVGGQQSHDLFALQLIHPHWPRLQRSHSPAPHEQGGALL